MALDCSDGYAAERGEVEAAEETLSRAADLQPYAAHLLMKVLYAARYARLDLLRAVCFLAQYISRWGQFCDRRLHRLMCYTNTTSV